MKMIFKQVEGSTPTFRKATASTEGAFGTRAIRASLVWFGGAASDNAL